MPGRARPAAVGLPFVPSPADHDAGARRLPIIRLPIIAR
jgi:hypothetical protein